MIIDQKLNGGKIPRTEETLNGTTPAISIPADTHNILDHNDDDRKYYKTVEVDSQCASVDAIFTITGPRARVLCPRKGAEFLEKISGTVDDRVFFLLQDLWGVVEIPSEHYWRCDCENSNVTRQHLEVVQRALAQTLPRFPNPLCPHTSFYGTRLEAITVGGYQTNQYQIVVAIDRIHGNGNKLFNILSRYSPSILTQVFTQSSLDSMVSCKVSKSTHAAEVLSKPRAGSTSDLVTFVSSIYPLHHRNLYVLVDENAAIDPFFDIDWSYTPLDDTSFRVSCPWWNQEGGSSVLDGLHAFSEIHIESVLFDIVNFLKSYIEAHWRTKVERCLALTSSVQLTRKPSEGSEERDSLLDVKLSFHIHFRIADQQALANIKELRNVMSTLQMSLDKALENAAIEKSTNLTIEGFPVELRVLQLVRRFVDFGVYSRWRAFRLPYNVKSPLASPNGPLTLVEAAADDLMIEELQKQLGVEVCSQGAVSVGAVAKSVLQTVRLSDDLSIFQKQHVLVNKLLYLFRFLLPIVPGITTLSHHGLKELLDPLVPKIDLCLDAEAATHKMRHMAFATEVMNLACIQRDSPTLDGASVKLLYALPGDVKPPQTEEPCMEIGPFSIAPPPRSHSPRITIKCTQTKALLAEVFSCLSPYYDAPRTPQTFLRGIGNRDSQGLTLSISSSSRIKACFFTAERITAQYEDSIRAYYVFQKQSKYCLKQNREHRDTYPQLYLTYGSIKVRCYSNDCYQRCLFISWSEPTNPAEKNNFSHAPDYPKHGRLLQIREALFPALPVEELVKRYGPNILIQSKHKVSQN